MAALETRQCPGNRPAMSSVIFMLGNEGATLPQPKHPAFFTEISTINTDATTGSEDLPSENSVTISMPEGYSTRLFNGSAPISLRLQNYITAWPQGHQGHGFTALEPHLMGFIIHKCMNKMCWSVSLWGSSGHCDL
ncbi:hypothetical protein CK203_048734 [Vitis vinifera]|uniref:Uncharacterized protein n=1 Tax=Vitis vinifera TaxID=29760 RepID=A0A438GDQ2_VITVI|nr:hypothetical protein CK203_048734 [Vitis vinifera]